MIHYLKPCPFCGNEKDVNVSTDIEIEELATEEGTGYFAVNCPFQIGGCGATGGYRETEEDAITAWNSRSEDV